MSLNLKQGSFVCAMSGQAICAATFAYATYRLGKYFVFDQKSENNHWDFNNLMNGILEKSLLGTTAALTCVLTGQVLQSLNS